MESSKLIDQLSTPASRASGIVGKIRTSPALLFFLFCSMGSTACLDPNPEPTALDPTGVTGFIFLNSLGQSLAERNFLERYTSTCATGSVCAIAVNSTSTYRGNLLSSGGASTGILSADALCNQDMAALGLPSTATWKALLSDGSSRVGFPGGQVDWVLRAGTTYERVAIAAIGGSTSFTATTIGTTNSNAVFDFPLNGALNDVGNHWTGMAADWSSAGGNNCSNWTSALSALSGAAGSSDTTSSALNFSNFTCNSPIKLVCVQQ